MLKATWNKIVLRYWKSIQDTYRLSIFTCTCPSGHPNSPAVNRPQPSWPPDWLHQWSVLAAYWNCFTIQSSHFHSRSISGSWNYRFVNKHHLVSKILNSMNARHLTEECLCSHTFIFLPSVQNISAVYVSIMNQGHFTRNTMRKFAFRNLKSR